MRGRRLAPWPIWLAALAACGHEGAFAPLPAREVGPFSAVHPVRLTFSIGDDRTPALAGSLVYFSRQTDGDERSIYTGRGREACLAALPIEGGTLRVEWCPRRFLSPLDTMVDTWMEPALSPDGAFVAYVWQRAYRVSALGYLDAYLVVVASGRPADSARYRGEVSYNEPGGTRTGGIATRLAWVDANTLRFLATWERIEKVKGGGAERVTDTSWVPLALMELDLRTGLQRAVPGGDSVIAYAPAAGGGLWVVREGSPTILLHLDPVTGERTSVGQFTSPIGDLVAVAGQPVAVVDTGQTIEWFDPATGSRSRLTGLHGAARRLVAAGGRRVVVEIDEAWAPFGAPTDLWLFELPGPLASPNK